MMETKMTAIASILENYFPMAQEETLHEIAEEIYGALRENAPSIQRHMRGKIESIAGKPRNALSAESR